jgi:hypothetical protein
LYNKYVRGKPEVELEEKKIKNQAAGQKQYAVYKRILGDDVPKTLDEFQEMKYNDPERWMYTKLDYKRRNELINHPELKLPNAHNSISKR